ncbi:MAG: tetratricopeptide repeat protein [Vampirovibrionales bacterium]|nr:tetratricopeptide repeat protein [Vampirovibrionales bacterium]
MASLSDAQASPLADACRHITLNAQEQQALKTAYAAGCYGPLSGYGVLRLVGPDASRFLQNQTTQDIASLKENDATLAAAVDRQGKIQGVFTLYKKNAETFFVLLEAFQIQGLLAHWQKFKILEQFEIEDLSPQLIPFAILGKNAETALKTFQKETESDGLNTFSSHFPFYFPFNGTGLPGYCLLPSSENVIALKETLANYLAQYKLSALTSQVQEALRIEAGLPAFGVEMNEHTLLPETGLQSQCVSYDKGCYLGQEVIARVKTYGSVQRALMGLAFEELDETTGELPMAGSVCTVMENGASKTIGIIKSSLQNGSLNKPIALAFLDKAHRTPGQMLAFEVAGQNYRAQVVLLPFHSSKENGEDRNTLLNEALDAFAKGEDARSIALLEALVHSDAVPVNSNAVTIQAIEALGVILGRQENPESLDKAIVLMEKLAALDPDHVMAHTNLSIFWLKKGDKDKAEDEKAKATVAGMRQKAKEAGFDLAKMAAERQAKELAHIRQLEERVQLFKDALAHSPDDPLGNYGLGSALLELKRYEEAIEPFEKTIKAQPTHSVAYLSLGKALENVGKSPDAKQIYERGIRVAASRGDRMPLEEMQRRLAPLQ